MVSPHIQFFTLFVYCSNWKLQFWLDFYKIVEFQAILTQITTRIAYTVFNHRVFCSVQDFVKAENQFFYASVRYNYIN